MKKILAIFLFLFLVAPSVGHETSKTVRYLRPHQLEITRVLDSITTIDTVWERQHNMHRDSVASMCQTYVPQYCTAQQIDPPFDPIFIMSILEQESVNPWNPLEYRVDARRLEEGFFLKYTEKLDYEAVAETLLAISWGLPQLMGESLLEMNYFVPPIDSLGVTAGLEVFCKSPEQQIEYAVRWYKRKLDIAHGDTKRALLIWNGGGDPDYPNKVLTRYKTLKGIYP